MNQVKTVYISKINGISFDIVINGEKGVFIIDDDYISYDEYTIACSNKYIPYFWMLESFLNNHVEGIKTFDRDTLEFIVNSIENTYEYYLEFRDHLLVRLNGGLETKSAK